MEGVQEKPIAKIKALYQYPCRGIRGFEVDQLFMSESGPKYDRMWVMLRKKDLKARSLANVAEMTRFRQKYLYNKDGHPDSLIIYIEKEVMPDLPVRKVRIPINRKFLSQDLIKGKENYEGYKEADAISEWLSEILGLEVVLIRASPDRGMPLIQDYVKLFHRDEGDRRAAFITDAAVHFINDASVRALKKDARPGNDFDHTTFRPSILIDEDPAYIEEEIFQARIANILFRQLGPCVRCKMTSINWAKSDRDELMEPYQTICETRQCDNLGPIFGTYMQPDIAYGMFDSKRDKEPKVMKGDEILVRVQERRYQIKAKKD